MSDSCKSGYLHPIVRPFVAPVRRLTHAEFHKSQKLAYRDDKRIATKHYGRRKRGTVVSRQDW